MKITTILGSPRKSGNTAVILREFEALASKANEVFRIDIAEKNVRGCRGCDACQKNLAAPGCRQDDDFTEIAGRILESDIVVYAAPVYVWDFPAQMKALMDRHYCLVKAAPSATIHLMEGKRVALLATCGGDAEGNADLIQQIFRREMDFLDCRVIGTYLVGNCGAPSALGGIPRQIAERMIAELSS